MSRRRSVRRTVLAACYVGCLFGLTLGLTCPPQGGDGAPFNPPILSGNRPPHIMITGVATPLGGNVAQQGDKVTVAYTAEDGEDASTVRVYASQSVDPQAAGRIELVSFRGATIGPGAGTGAATWDTTGAVVGEYYIFAEIDDQLNPPVFTAHSETLLLTPIPPKGTQALNSPPELVFLEPLPNLGLAAMDEVTVRYIYADLDSPEVTVTLLLDKDQDPTNDDISNPGDPQDEDTNIIILPTTARLTTDPTFDGDPPPPDDPDNLPIQSDSVEIRTNPRTFGPTVPVFLPFPGAPIAGELKEYRFVIDFSKIPVRSKPYFIRATISDGIATAHSYAVGSITISSLASGVVDLEDIGFSLAGARFQGFSEKANLGTDFITTTDLDLDGVEDFMVAGQFASPRNRFQSGGAYLIYGRRKTPFPPDTNNNGRPDVPDPLGGVIDFPEPPDYLPDPYNAANVGRFGGVVSINSVSSFFRGTIYAMPEAHGFTPPPASLFDEYSPFSDHPDSLTAGLTSIARVDMTKDGIADFVFGLPYISAAWDHHDDDPADGCELPYAFAGDVLPNLFRCDIAPADDDIVSERNPPFPGWNEVNQGQVIAVDATNDVRITFNTFLDANLAGQHDPNGAIDDEGVLQGGGFIPRGMRFRGGWFDPEPMFARDASASDCCSAHEGIGCDDPDCETLVCIFLPECCGVGEEEPGWSGACAQFAQAICSNVCTEVFHYSDSEFGRTVAALPDFDNDPGDELLISRPGYDPAGGLYADGSPKPFDPDDLDRGSIQVWLSHNFISEGWYADEVFSLPSYAPCPGGSCTGSDPDICIRCFVPLPSFITVIGEQPGDRFGYASAAGQFNQDGTEDILAGAPGADRNGLVDNGVMYVLMIHGGGFGDTDLGSRGLPRLEVVGTHDGDRFGLVQTGVLDINDDGIDDVAFASEYYDDLDNLGSDVGYVGVIFGNRPLTGEVGFFPEEVGTASLWGVRFLGVAAGARAGHDVASGGDFNGDGVGDLLITSPGETRNSQGQVRLGVTYLIFGGRHLHNKSFNLSQVGSRELPGIVFISRYELGSDDEATLETVGSLGDIDGDGFGDIAIGAPRADFVNPNAPEERRSDAGEFYIIYGSNFGSNFIDP